MAKDRILGSSAKIELYQASGQVLTLEVDSFSSSSKHTTKARHPLGEVGEYNQLVYMGYDLDFTTGKIDSTAVNFFNAIDQALLAGQAAPKVRVVQTIQHFDGNVEVWIYQDTVLYGYKDDASTADDEIKESFKGVAKLRVKG